MSLRNEYATALHSAFDAIAIHVDRVTLHELIDFASYARGYKGGFDDAISVVNGSSTLELTMLPDPNNEREACLFVQKRY